MTPSARRLDERIVTDARKRTFLPERLFARLDAARRAPVAIVIGDEGLGKSTLIRDYLALRGIAYLRFTAGTEHAAPGELLRGLARTFASLSPAMARSCGLAAQKLQAGDGAAVALGWAREHLAGISTTVVLDNLHHVLAEPRCAAFLCALIDATAPDVHWILAVRDASALPLPRWLSSGRCGLPIESDELRVQPDEIQAEFSAAGIRLADAAAIALYEATHGSPLVLRIALATGRIDGNLSRDDVYDGLVEAAFARCPADVHDRIYETAAIARFDAAVLSALECTSDFAALLDECELVHALDDSTEAYYEPCRSRILARLRALDLGRRGAIVDRAVGALQRVGRWREAIELRVESGDLGGIARVLDACGFSALDHGDVAGIGAALAVLPDTVLNDHPVALALKAALASLNDSFDVSEAWFRMAIDRARNHQRREIVLRYGLDLVRRGRPDAVELLESDAARDERHSAPDEEAALWALLGTAYVAAGAPQKAREAARRAVVRLPGVVDDSLRARILHQASYVALNDGDWKAAKSLAERALARAEDVFLYDLAARALSVLFNVAWLHEENVESARSALARLEEAGRKAGSDSLRLYAILNAYAIEVDAGDAAALERLNAQLTEMQVLLTRTVSEALLPAQALRAAWDGHFAHAYDLLAPGADKLVDRQRAAYRWAEVAVYAAAAAKRSAAREAIDCSRERLARVAPAAPLAVRTLTYLALAETLLDEDALAAASIVEARVVGYGAPARVRSLIDTVAAFADCRRRGPSALLRLGEMLDLLERHQLGGVARFIGRLPVETIETPQAASEAALGVAG